jgi:hypothetical protein
VGRGDRYPKNISFSKTIDNFLPRAARSVLVLTCAGSDHAIQVN